MQQLRLFTLLALSTFFLLLTAPTSLLAQDGPISIEGLQPDSGFPGHEMEVRIFGSGFEQIQDLQIHIDDVEIIAANVESDELIWAAIIIPPDAQPGPKMVALTYILDNTPFRAVRRDGFEILPSDEQPPASHIELFSVEPAEGSPDTEMEIFLRGAGFASIEEFAVFIEGIEIFNQWIESDELIGLDIYIPEDAQPGWRRIGIEMMQNGNLAHASLDPGFNVLEIGRRPPPATGPSQPGTRGTSGTGGTSATLPPWIWPLTTILLMAASFVLGRGLGYSSKLTWTDKAKLQWRHEANTELPQPQKACQWACKATAGANLLNRWQVTRIDLTPLKVKGKTAQPKFVDNKDGALDPLNDLANITSALNSRQSRGEKITGLVDELLSQIQAWEREGQSPAAVRLDAKLAGAIDATFGLYHCHQAGGVLSWGKDPLLKWKAKLNQPAGEHLGILRGPAAGEEDFAARARHELQEFILDMMESVQIWL